MTTTLKRKDRTHFRDNLLTLAARGFPAGIAFWTIEGRTEVIDSDKSDAMWRRDLTFALSILDHWGCSVEEVDAIIGRSPLEAETSGEVEDCSARVYDIIGIDDTLRLAFNNPENIHGFVRQPNSNAPFNGRKAIDMMDSAEGIKTVRRALDGHFRGSAW